MTTRVILLRIVCLIANHPPVPRESVKVFLNSQNNHPLMQNHQDKVKTKPIYPNLALILVVVGNKVNHHKFLFRDTQAFRKTH